MFGLPMFAALCCLLCVCGLLLAEYRHATFAKVLLKLGASSAFVAFALLLGAASTPYGRLIVVALALSWVGDALLLSHTQWMFLGGLVAFLLAHVAYTAAFWLIGPPLGVFLLIVLGFSIPLVLIVRWLWPHLSGFYRLPVSAYIGVIAIMGSMACASAYRTGVWALAVGAVGFAASDVAVAREQFVTKSIVNKLWGLPLYYAAQLLLAWSVTIVQA